MLDVVLEDREGASITSVLLVSILVVLDVVLEECMASKPRTDLECFNPCCAGCSSGSIWRNGLRSRFTECFNPCCAGCSSGSLYR